jgi:prepilin-type N-terminal cleavage/methylation domain-containing protein
MTGSDRQQRTLNVTHISDRNSRALGGAAFTLVELLVVIVVISLLAVIVAPTMNMAAEKASQHKCRTRLQSLHGGVVAYGADNRNLVPIVHEGSSKGTVGKLLASGGRFASKYLEQSPDGEGSDFKGMTKIDNIFQCPAALEYPDPAGNNKLEGTNYNLSGFGVFTGGTGLKPEGMHPNTMTISGTVQSNKKDGSGQMLHPPGEVAMAVDYIEMRGVSNNQAQYNHKDGVNVLFGSGSAKWFGYGSLRQIGSTNMLKAPGTYGFVKGGSTGIYAPCTHVIGGGGTDRRSAAGVMW